MITRISGSFGPLLPHLKYSVPASAPYTMVDKELLEKVQMRAIMMGTNIKGSYEERLAILGMKTLEDRRIRGDLIVKMVQKTNEYLRQTHWL